MYKTNSKTKNLKNLFPIFQRYPNLIFLDNASTTQKPKIPVSYTHLTLPTIYSV